MTNNTFENVFNSQIERCKEILIIKAREYARNDDRLHNFNKAARMLGTNPAGALWGMLIKHLVSVSDIVEDAGKREFVSDEILTEKITDTINYFILLKAVIIEMKENDKGIV